MGSSRPVVIGRMGDGKTCAHRAIEERIQAAIRPSLERADRALWELENPRVTIGRHTDEWFQPVEPTFTPIAAGGRITHTPDDTRRWRPAYHSRLHP